MLRRFVSMPLLCLIAALMMIQGTVLRAQEQAPVAEQTALATAPRLPQDVYWAVILPDISALRNEWKNSRFAEAYNSTEAAKLRELVQAEWQDMKTEFKEDTNVEFDTLVNHFEGFAAFFATAYDPAIEEFTQVFLATVPEPKQEQVRATVEELIANDVPQDARKEAEDYQGVKIYRVTYSEELESDDWTAQLNEVKQMKTVNMEYAFAGNLLLFSEGTSSGIKSVINTLKSTEAPSLDQSTDFRKLAADLGGVNDGLIWVNVPKILEIARSADDQEFISGLDQMGLSSLGSAMLTFDLSGDGLHYHGGAVMPREKKGIVEMLYAGRTNTVETARFVPADAYRYSSYTLDFGAVWKSIRQMALQMNPQADALINGWTMTFKQNYGIDVENDLIANIQGEHAYYRRPAPNAPSANDATLEAPVESIAAMIGLTNGQQTIDSLDALFTKLSGEPFYMPIKSLSQEGMKIWTMSEDNPMPAGRQFAVGLTPQYIVIGNGIDEVQQSIRHIRGEAQGSLAQTPDFQQAIGGIKKENLRGFAYTSPGTYDSIVTQYRFLLENIHQSGAMDVELSPEDVPNADWWKRYFGSCFTTFHLTADMARMDGTVGVVKK